MTSRHLSEAERQFEGRHLIRVRLSRVSRTLQPLTFRQFPLVMFKILGGCPLFLPCHCYSSSFSSSFRPSATLAYSREWQSVAKRRSTSQKRDKRLTLPARANFNSRLEILWKTSHAFRKDDFPFTTLRSREGDADLAMFRADSFTRVCRDIPKIIRFSFHFVFQVPEKNVVLKKIEIWSVIKFQLFEALGKERLIERSLLLINLFKCIIEQKNLTRKKNFYF